MSFLTLATPATSTDLMAGRSQFWPSHTFTSVSPLSLAGSSRQISNRMVVPGSVWAMSLSTSTSDS